MPVVLDACALLAHFQGEPGGDHTMHAIHSGNAVIHAINLAEVYYQLLRVPGINSQLVEGMMERYRSAGLRISEDLSPEIWRGAAEFRAPVRRIAFADCFAVALARSLNCPVMTSDRREFDRPEVLGQCQILFIR